MKRKLIVTAAALPLLFLAGSAMATEWPIYPHLPASGPVVMFATPSVCTGDCAAVREKVVAAAARHPDVAFRDGPSNEQDACLYVTAGRNMVVAKRCGLTDGDGLAAIIDREADFAKGMQSMVSNYEDLLAKLETARAPFESEADEVRAQEEAALHDKHVDALPAGTKEREDVDAPFKDKLRDIEHREIEATRDVLKESQDALARVKAAIEAHEKDQKPATP